MKCAPLMIILFEGASVPHPIDRTLIRGREQSASESTTKIRITKPKNITCFFSTIVQF